MADEPPFISLEDAARRVVAVYIQEAATGALDDMPRLAFAVGLLQGTLDFGRDGTMESDAT